MDSREEHDTVHPGDVCLAACISCLAADSWLMDSAVIPDKAKAAANTVVFYSAMAWLLLDTDWPSFTTSFSAKDSLVTGQAAANTGVF